MHYFICVGIFGLVGGENSEALTPLANGAGSTVFRLDLTRLQIYVLGLGHSQARTHRDMAVHGPSMRVMEWGLPAFELHDLNELPNVSESPPLLRERKKVRLRICQPPLPPCEGARELVTHRAFSAARFRHLRARARLLDKGAELRHFCLLFFRRFAKIKAVQS